MAKVIRLPDLEAGWRWPRQLNIHTADIKQECLNWVSSFGAFTPRHRRPSTNVTLVSGTRIYLPLS
ncbi:hypothetical protein BKA67DRAFT_570194, partial [Truncatella angustata]